jgi:glycine oxidase
VSVLGREPTDLLIRDGVYAEGSTAGAEVVDAVRENGRVAGARTADGEVYRASRLVLAAGCWSGSVGWLPAEARPPVRPVKGQVVRLRHAPAAPLCEHAIRTPRVYVIPRPEGEVVVGATVEERGFDETVTAGAVFELLREARRALPDIDELELVEASAGLRPGSADNGPYIGRAALDGVVYATGHYRNGILLAPITADAVAALLASQAPPPEVSPFGPDRARAAAVDAR